MPSTGTYLYRRPGSQNWWLRLQHTEVEGRYYRKYERSLRTPNRELAEIRAATLVADHKSSVFFRKQVRIDAPNKTDLMYEPGRMHVLEDGMRVLATETELTYIDQENNVVKKSENAIVRFMTPIIQTAEDKRVFDKHMGISDKKSQRYNILETWFEHRNISKHIQNEAKGAWDLFSKITENKPISKCTREDGRKLARAIMNGDESATDAGRKPNSSKTAEKKIGHLRAACNIAISDGKMTLNPFVDVVPLVDDANERVPLDDDDMKLISESLSLLREEDQLLWLWLANTGMRLDEPFQVEKDQVEKGVRYVIIGSKTPTSRRRVPIPSRLLERLPLRIEQSLFSGTSETAAKRIRYFLRRIGVSYDPQRGTGSKSKVVHSLRHRAKDKLRAAGCPTDIQYEILGHEYRTVASSYGVGYPMKDILHWVDMIGIE